MPCNMPSSGILPPDGFILEDRQFRNGDMVIIKDGTSEILGYIQEDQIITPIRRFDLKETEIIGVLRQLLLALFSGGAIWNYIESFAARF